MIRRFIRRLCLWQAQRFERDTDLHGKAAAVALLRGDVDAYDQFTGYLTQCKQAAAWWRERAERHG